MFIEFHNHDCFVKDKEIEKVLIQGRNIERLYKMDLCKGNKPENQKSKVYTAVKELWYRKLGHPSQRIVSKVLQLCNVKTKDNEKFDLCDSCQHGKLQFLPFQKSQSYANRPFELIHYDMWGPTPITSTNDFNYYIYLLDDFSRFTWIYPLRSKVQVVTTFIHFKNLVENQLDGKIKVFQSDQGGEF